MEEEVAEEIRWMKEMMKMIKKTKVAHLLCLWF